MTDRRRQYLLWAVLVAALLGLTAAALWHGPTRRLGGSPGATDRPLVVTSGEGANVLHDYGALPEFGLVSQTGDSVHLADLRGNVWVADFIFTNCASTCPMMTAQLSRLQKALAGETRARLVSFSVDPVRDTPERLAEYAKGYGATPDRWLFLTGDQQQVRTLSIDGFHLSAGDATPQDLAAGAEAVMHSTRLVLVDGNGHVRGYYDGTKDESVNELGDAVRKLIAASKP